MSRRQILLTAILLSMFNLFACTTTRTWEIDTRSAADFHWNGRIRIVEQTSDSIGPLLTFTKRTSAHSIELVGDNGRNVVVRPTGHAANEHPIGRVETEGELHPAIEEVLRMSLESEYPMLTRASIASTQPVAATSPADSANGADEAMRECEKEFFQLMQARQMLNEGKYDQLSCGEAIAAASTGASYSVFDLGEGVTLKAWVENTSPTVMRATVSSGEGKVIYEYKPVELPLREISNPTR